MNVLPSLQGPLFAVFSPEVSSYLQTERPVSLLPIMITIRLWDVSSRRPAICICVLTLHMCINTVSQNRTQLFSCWLMVQMNLRCH